MMEGPTGSGNRNHKIREPRKGVGEDHSPIYRNVRSVPCRYASVASGATAVKHRNRKNDIRHICKTASEMPETPFERLTLYSYVLNQSMNENMLQATPINRQKPRKTWPM